MTEYVTITVDSNKDLKDSRDRVEKALTGLPFEIYTLQRPDTSIDLCVRSKDWDGRNIVDCIMDRLNYDKISSHVELWNPEEGEDVVYHDELYKFKVCRLSECCIEHPTDGSIMRVPNNKVKPVLMFNV